MRWFLGLLGGRTFITLLGGYIPPTHRLIEDPLVKEQSENDVADSLEIAHLGIFYVFSQMA